jgi:hypothetical protein
MVDPPATAKPKRKLPDSLAALVAFEALEPHLDKLRSAYAHGNRALFYDNLLIAYLLAFYNATIRSLRTIELLAHDDRFSEHFTDSTLKRSAFSEAGKTFDAQLLGPLIKQLYAQAPDLRRTDPKLRLLIEKLHIFDGSIFTIASHVAWALAHRTRDGAPHAHVRIDFCFRVLDNTVASLQVSGKDRGSEAASFIDQIRPGQVYIADRNFVHFGFMRAVLDQSSDFVLRARDDAPNMNAIEDRPLTAADRAQGVIADELVELPAAGAPKRTLRRVTVLDEKGRTILLLISHNKNGITLQFYVAVIGMLLIYIKTGRKPDKYSLILLQHVAGGGSMESMLPWLQTRWREKDLDKARRARKAAAQKIAAV